MTQEKSEFLRGILTLTLSKYFVRALAVAKGLAVARFLGPDLYGVFGILAVFMGYAAYADLGIFGGLTKTVPVHLVRGETEEVDEEEAAGFSAVLLATLVFALAVGAMLLGRRPEVAAAAPALGFAMVAQQVFKKITVMLRSRSRFMEAALAFTVLQVLDVVFVLALLLPLKVTGVFLGQGIAFLVTGAVLARRSGLRFRLRWNPRLAAGLVGSGLPLMIATLTFLLLQTVDRFLIVGYLDTVALGHYMIAVFCASMIYYIPHSLSYVLFPGYRERLAALPPGTPPPERYVDLPARLLSYLLPPVTALVFLGTPIIGLLLPEYVPGLASARILLMGTFFLALVSSANAFVIAADRHWALMAIQSVTVALDVALNLFALRAGHGIEGVAAATGVSYLFYATAALTLSYRITAVPFAGIPRRLGELYLPFLYVLAVTLAVASWSRLEGGGDIVTVIVREGVFLVALLPGLWWLQRARGGVTEVFAMIKGTVRP